MISFRWLNADVWITTCLMTLMWYSFILALGVTWLWLWVAMHPIALCAWWHIYPLSRQRKKRHSYICCSIELTQLSLSDTLPGVWKKKCWCGSRGFCKIRSKRWHLNKLNSLLMWLSRRWRDFGPRSFVYRGRTILQSKRYSLLSIRHWGAHEKRWSDEKRPELCSGLSVSAGIVGY